MFGYTEHTLSLVGFYQQSNFKDDQNMSMWYKMRMKFDVVIGNPPYQEMKEDGTRKGKGVNLWSKFISLGMNIAKDGGKVAMITPTSWISPSIDLSGQYKVNGEERLWNVFNSYSTYANVIDVAKHFKGVGSTFGYFIVDKSKHDGLKFSDGADTSLGFLPKSGQEECLEKLSKTNNIGDNYEIARNNTSEWRVSVPITRTLSESSIEILKDYQKPTTGSQTDEALYFYIVCSDMNECQKIRNKIISCLDILNIHCRWSGFLNLQLLKMIKL
jgi:hypothetical protein